MIISRINTKQNFNAIIMQPMPPAAIVCKASAVAPSVANSARWFSEVPSSLRLLPKKSLPKVPKKPTKQVPHKEFPLPVNTRIAVVKRPLENNGFRPANTRIAVVKPTTNDQPWVKPNYPIQGRLKGPGRRIIDKRVMSN